MNLPSAGLAVTGQASRTIGCRVDCQGRPSSGIVERPAAIFSPNVRNAVCWRASLRLGGSVRWRTCVNPGSVSTKARTGMFMSHGPSGFTAETFSTTSADAHKSSMGVAAGEVEHGRLPGGVRGIRDSNARPATLPRNDRRRVASDAFLVSRRT